MARIKERGGASEKLSRHGGEDQMPCGEDDGCIWSVHFDGFDSQKRKLKMSVGWNKTGWSLFAGMDRIR